MMKLSNPYNFANPVSDEALFVDRKRELADINYYLDLAGTSPQAINFALVGPRAIGKTSLLNMTEIEAKKRGFCTVRIDLDEGDSQTQIGFFFKLFDSTFNALCDLGAFGGIRGDTYRTYLQLVYGPPARRAMDRMPAPPRECSASPSEYSFPFLFPIQYARAVSNGNANGQISDSALRSDLTALRAATKRPIILIFDEANVLTESRFLLQKTRNMFSSVPGFLVVMAGTPELFPAMDHVYSPVGRQFKKIFVHEFESPGATELCVRRPLESIGVVPEEVFDFSGPQVKALHLLTGGRPYEIQLVCHTMFRKMQEHGTPNMQLDLEVLDELRLELETSPDFPGRLAELRMLMANTKRGSTLETSGFAKDGDGVVRSNGERAAVEADRLTGNRDDTKTTSPGT